MWLNLVVHMKRFHALEWEDLPWFPQSWRDYGTDYLRFIATKFDIYKPVLHLIKQGIDNSGQPEWIDLASGAGSGLINLAKALKSDQPNLKITLTDYYPNLQAFENTQRELPGIFEFETVAVNALSPPEHLQGKFKTIFGAFHHFRPNEARAILQNAVDTHSPIAIFEPVGRNFGSWSSMIFVPIFVLVFTPFIRPIRWQVLPFIYLLPIIPLYILWDGVASILRTYSEKEVHALVAAVEKSDTYAWEIGKTPGPMPIFYLLGYKK
ncbi:hypothetical protein Halhy_0760 [Haliscomenobacter hydrossis DSM 1100]|uniref:Class I SAM-dependent methyltransferase n=2 Tax=Haliscomenobacter TaxID=2349 RepID=F4L3R3_HALH1|nr:hypothetical protein Halhy_0760 [Haliscomenobacter hydrossis DSM 1100]